VGEARPRPIDVRFLAATNRPLDALMTAGQFREDLYFRLSVFPIHVPPLRDRREDIPTLGGYFLGQLGHPRVDQVALRDDVARELMARTWSGNVRELRNAIERAAILARSLDIRIQHLPPPGRPGIASTDSTQEIASQIARWTETELRQPTISRAGEATLYDRFLALVEPPLLRSVLQQHGGNRAMAAQRVGIHRATLRQKLRKYRLE
jgi:two-component system nitrogen regulation response regulator GlnG